MMPLPTANVDVTAVMPPLSIKYRNCNSGAKDESHFTMPIIPEHSETKKLPNDSELGEAFSVVLTNIFLPCPFTNDIGV